MAKQRTEPTVVDVKLSATKLVKAKNNCSCLGRGYHVVEHGYTRDNVLRPIVYGMPYIQTKVLCPCTGE